jgi:hypothetical protein
LDLKVNFGRLEGFPCCGLAVGLKKLPFFFQKHLARYWDFLKCHSLEETPLLSFRFEMIFTYISSMETEKDNLFKLETVSEMIRKSLSDTKNQEIVKEKERQVKEQESIPKIVELKSIVEIITGKLNPIFEKEGGIMKVIKNESVPQPKSKENFIEVLYYPKNRQGSVKGVNTAALRFEFDPKNNEVHILKRESLFPLPLKQVETIPILGSDTAAKISEQTKNFALTLAAKSF